MNTIKGLTTAEIQAIIADRNSPNIKKYYVYDGSGDITDVYYAQAMTVDSGICLRQHFDFVVVSGMDLIQKESWITDRWNSDWDASDLYSDSVLITSSTYTIATTNINNVVTGTLKAAFLANLVKDDANQIWNETGLSATILEGDTLVVTAEDGFTIATYTVGATVAAPEGPSDPGFG
jgi:hypothetical protein